MDAGILIFGSLAVLCAAYSLLIYVAGSGTGFFAVWLLLALGLLLLAFDLRYVWLGRLPGVWRWLVYGGLGLGLCCFAGIEALILSSFAADTAKPLSYLVVLGAQVREDGPSRVLAFRLDRAAQYLKLHEQCICIVSGGQGDNEPCPEAAAMAAYLEAKGIVPERILQEGSSRNTAENLANCAAIIREREGDPLPPVGIVTNDFHLYRALGIARRHGLSGAVGLAAPSVALYLPNNMLREGLGVVKDLVCGNMSLHLGSLKAE